MTVEKMPAICAASDQNLFSLVFSLRPVEGLKIERDEGGSESSQVPDSTQLKWTVQIYSKPVLGGDDRGDSIIFALRFVPN